MRKFKVIKKQMGFYGSIGEEVTENKTDEFMNHDLPLDCVVVDVDYHGDTLAQIIELESLEEIYDTH